MLRLVLVICAALCAGLADAATYRVEEAGTFPQESTAPMRWRQIAPSRGGDNTVEGTTTVNIRLNLAPWLNRTGRLFMVLPEQPLTPVRVSWSTQGRLMPGQLVSGQRALVYAGPITTPLLEETLVLKFEADGTRLSSAQTAAISFRDRHRLT